MDTFKKPLSFCMRLAERIDSISLPPRILLLLFLLAIERYVNDIRHSIEDQYHILSGRMVAGVFFYLLFVQYGRVLKISRSRVARFIYLPLTSAVLLFCAIVTASWVFMFDAFGVPTNFLPTMEGVFALLLISLGFMWIIPQVLRIVTGTQPYIEKVISGEEEIPILAGVMAGFYPLLFIVANNLSLLISPRQFVFMMLVYTLPPAIILTLASRLGKKNRMRKRSLHSLIAFTMAVFLLFFLRDTILAMPSPVIIAVVGLTSLFCWKFPHVYRYVTFILIVMSAIATAELLVRIDRARNTPDEWAKISHEFAKLEITKRFNVYYIQPDAYVNPRELRKPPYNFDNSFMEDWLLNQGFRIHEGYRANYWSTLSSDSSMFMMKHHYWEVNPASRHRWGPRAIIGGRNHVVDIFKNNGYKTHFVNLNSFLNLYGKISYDYCSHPPPSSFSLIRKNEATNTGRGLDAILEYLAGMPDGEKFVFISFYRPGHIAVRPDTSKGAANERLAYLENLGKANEWIRAIVDHIIRHDPTALIIISADHGAYVGEDSKESYMNPAMVWNEEKAWSLFSALLAIKWPEGSQDTEGCSTPQSAVNLFRHIFSCLSESSIPFENMEPDVSLCPRGEKGKAQATILIDGAGQFVSSPQPIMRQPSNRLPEEM